MPLLLQPKRNTAQERFESRVNATVRGSNSQPPKNFLGRNTPRVGQAAHRLGHISAILRAQPALAARLAITQRLGSELAILAGGNDDELAASEIECAWGHDHIVSAN